MKGIQGPDSSIPLNTFIIQFRVIPRNKKNEFPRASRKIICFFYLYSGDLSEKMNPKVGFYPIFLQNKKAAIPNGRRPLNSFRTGFPD